MDIITPRTVLSFISENDYEEVLGLYHEPDTFRFIPHLEGWSEEKYIDLLNRKIEENKAGIGYYWIARNKENGKLVGAMNVNKMRLFDKMQIGFQISRKFWNQGYGSELCQAVLKHIIEDKKYPEIYAVFELKNSASRRILEKCGFNFLKSYTEKDVELNIVKYP
jgi:ribosomal-protein-alanine N-acetyltransferase